MIQAGAIYEGQYLLGTSIARPLIAKGMIEVARREKAEAIAHGATGKGNDQVRFELTAAALAPDLQIIAPWRDASVPRGFPRPRGDDRLLREQGKFPCRPAPRNRIRWTGTSCTFRSRPGILEDPWLDAFATGRTGTCSSSSVSPEDAPDQPEYVTLDFVKGNCVAVNGRKLTPLGVMQALNKLGGKHGVGRVDMVENRYVGMKSRGVYETPGGAILHFAHRQMETLTMDREVMHLRDSLIPRYAELVYYGYWFAPERLALQALVTESQRNVTGTVRVKLYKGNIMVAGRKSPVSLYNPRHRHDGSGPDEGLQPGRRHRFHPAERPAVEGGRESAEEEVNAGKLEVAMCDRFI